MSTSINSADFDAVCAEVGKTVSYSTESTTVNDYGDITGNPTSRGNIVVIFQELDDREQAVEQGLINVGDARIFFKSSTLSADNPPALHDIITASSVNYRIVHLFREEIGGNTIFWEALCKRIQT